VARKSEILITPAVLEWAIAESGLPLADVAAGTGVGEDELQRWLAKTAKPSVSELRRLAKKLHRQVAVFLLPSPPKDEQAHVQFRHPIGAQRSRALTADERRFLRRAKRLQDAQAWLVTELERVRPDLPRIPQSEKADVIARTWRERLGITVAAQRAWRSPSVAFDAWRSVVEATGVTVVQFSMGSESCRGFSLWDEWAPLIAINTAWADEARSFTLFHELGHLLTRTNSVCAAEPMAADAGDRIERWCEEFAAALLIPRDALFGVGRVTRLATLSDLARKLRVSLRATAIRLIKLGLASWPLYDEIPRASDSKPKGGGGTGRSRREIREDEFGARTTEIFVAAVRREIITESQVLDYLDIPSSEFERLAVATSR
jgi:Zn-dependent peptidase ImmA (M78 family)